MSKRWILGLALLGAAFLAQPASAQQPVDVAIVINGQTLDKEPPPRMVDGRVLIPLRKVFNALGATVKYENKVIDAQRGSQSVSLSPGVNVAKLNGQETPLDVPPILIDTVTYVPLRFVAQALGDSVNYDAAAKTITVTPSATAGPQVPPVPPERLAILKDSLKRLVVGHQGAILKVWNPEMNEVAYYRGIDDRAVAPYKAEDQQKILDDLGYSSTLGGTAEEMMNGFLKLPRREAVAFLGMVHSIPDASPLDPPDEVDIAIKKFLIQALKEDKDVAVRRQACLALAVGDPLDDDIINAVLDFYAGSENLWETFPVQQFFEFQAAKIRLLPNLAQIRERVAAVNSLYTPAALRYLDGQEN